MTNVSKTYFGLSLLGSACGRGGGGGTRSGSPSSGSMYGRSTAGRDAGATTGSELSSGSTVIPKRTSRPRHDDIAVTSSSRTRVSRYVRVCSCGTAMNTVSSRIARGLARRMNAICRGVMSGLASRMLRVCDQTSAMFSSGLATGSSSRVEGAPGTSDPAVERVLTGQGRGAPTRDGHGCGDAEVDRATGTPRPHSCPQAVGCKVGVARAARRPSRRRRSRPRRRAANLTRAGLTRRGRAAYRQTAVPGVLGAPAWRKLRTRPRVANDLHGPGAPSNGPPDPCAWGAAGRATDRRTT